MSPTHQDKKKMSISTCVQKHLIYELQRRDYMHNICPKCPTWDLIHLVLIIYFFRQCSLQLKDILVQTASLLFLTNNGWHRKILLVGQEMLVILVGPHIFWHWLTGNHCYNFVLHDLQKLLGDATLAIRAGMWYVYGSAPANFSCPVQDVFNSIYVV